MPPPSNCGNGATSKSGAFLFVLAWRYAYGQLRMNAGLPFSKARRDSSSMYVVTAFGAAPSLMPSIMNWSALRFSGESNSAFLPSSDSTLPPAAKAISRKSQVRPS